MKQTYLTLSLLCVASLCWAQFGYRSLISTDNLEFDAPRKVIPADMDNDGDIDLVAAGVFNPHIAWFNNLDGKGNYSNPIILDYFQHFSSEDDFAIGDVDNDGDNDVIITKDDEVFFYENSLRPGYFDTPQKLGPIPFEVDRVFITDFNGDGFKDILCQGFWAQLGWLQGKNDRPDFHEFQIIDSPYAGEGVHISDLDLDGDLDILAPNFSSEFVVWLENINGYGTFSESKEIAVDPENLDNVLTGDFDGDNDLDVMVYSDFQDYIKWFEHEDGNGNFVEEHLIIDTSLTTVSRPIIVDFDGDTHLDLLFTVSGRLRFYKNDGQGKFTFEETIFSLNSSLNSLEFADVNGDGIDDFFVTADGNTDGIDQLLLFLRRADGSFENPKDLIADADRPTFMKSFDLDQDGIKELITGHENYGRFAWQAYENTSRKFQNSHILLNGIYRPNDIDFADFDGDNEIDIVMVYEEGFSDGIVSWMRKIPGENNYEPNQILFATNYYANHISTGDIDGDNDIDICFFGHDSPNRTLVILQNTNNSGVFGDTIQLDLQNFGVEYVQIVDVDGDDDLDVLGAKSNINSPLFWFENKDGNGDFSDMIEIIDFQANIEGVAFKDMDSDGAEDLVYNKWIDDNIVWRKNMGGGAFGDENVFNNPFTNDRDFDVIDLDRDGDNDIVLLTNVGLVWFQNLGGSGALAPASLVNGDFTSLSKVFFEDFDLDGDLDATTYTSSLNDGVMYLHENFFRESIDAPSVTGFVYLDLNENGEFELGEPKAFSQNVSIMPDALASISSSADFSFFVENGIFEVGCTPLENFQLSTPSPLEVDLSTNQSTEVNFGLIPLFDDLRGIVPLTSSPTRCGFEVPFWINYQNTGTLIADGVIELELDSLVEFVSSEPMPDSIVGNTIYWSFEDLLPTHSDRISMFLQMPDEDFVGEYINMVTKISMTSQDGSQTSEFYEGYRSEIRCAIDPNDKLVNPNIPGYDNYTLFDDTLDYTVRFQNTGNDTAFTVRIEDFLDANLDYSTFRVLGASHNYETTLDFHSGRLMVVFEDILLPDSTTNEPKSHGFIRYEIQQKTGLPERSVVDNTAYIYFDFNAPIITNTVTNVLVSQYPLVLDIQHPRCFGMINGSIEVIEPLPIFSSYEWSIGGGGTKISNLGQGDYSLTVQTSLGTTIDTLITIEMPELLSVTDLEIMDVSCFGFEDGLIEVEASGGVPSYFYEWSNDILGPLNSDISGGNYLLNLVDGNDCLTQSFYTIEEPAVLELEKSSIDETNDDMNGSATVEPEGGTTPYSYVWDTNPTQTTQTIENLSTGIYKVTVTDANDCTKTTTIIVDRIVGTNAIEKDFVFNVSPNPSDGKVLVDFDLESFKPYEIEVHNSLGQLIQEYDFQTPNIEKRTLEIELTSGVYLISLKVENEVWRVERLVVQK